MSRLGGSDSIQGVALRLHKQPRRYERRLEGACMLWTVVVVLLILWLLGFTMHVGGGIIHLLLVIALVVVVFQLLSGRKI